MRYICSYYLWIVFVSAEPLGKRADESSVDYTLHAQIEVLIAYTFSKIASTELVSFILTYYFLIFLGTSVLTLLLQLKWHPCKKKDYCVFACK